MNNRMVISLKIQLAQTTTGGAWIRVNIELTSEGDIPYGSWKQIGSIDDRFPTKGIFQTFNSVLAIKENSSRSSDFYVHLEGLTNITSQTSGRGLARLGKNSWYLLDKWRRRSRFESRDKPVGATWKGVGSWTIRENDWQSTANRRFLTTKWKVGGSAGGGGGIALAASGGYFKLTDPQGTSWQFFYSGLGVGAGAKEKVGQLSQFGCGLSPESLPFGLGSLPSAGGIFKNPTTVLDGRAKQRGLLWSMHFWRSSSFVWSRCWWLSFYFRSAEHDRFRCHGDGGWAIR